MGRFSLVPSYRSERDLLRRLIVSGHSMDTVDLWRRRGVISERVHARFERLWAWSTATEHRLTRHVPLKAWLRRRERLRRLIAHLPQAAAL